MEVIYNVLADFREMRHVTSIPGKPGNTGSRLQMALLVSTLR